MRYIALIDGEPGTYGVVFPDLPGCTAMAATLDQAMTSASAALNDWVRTVRNAGTAVPAPRSAIEIRIDPEVAEALAGGRRWPPSSWLKPLENQCERTFP